MTNRDWLISAIFALFLGLSGASFAQTIIQVNPDRTDGQNFVPITSVTYSDQSTNPATTIIQNSESTAINSGFPYSRTTPFILDSLRVNVGTAMTPDIKDLIYSTVVYNVALRGFGVNGTTPNAGGVRVIESDGTTFTTLAPNATAREAWRLAVGDAMVNDDLLNYIIYDGNTSPLPPNGSPDWDVVFSHAMQEDDYLLVQERDGNTFFLLEPLDAVGAPIPGANFLFFGSCAGSPSSGCGGSTEVYDWNTGLVSGVYQNAQPMGFSVASIAKFFEGTGIPLASQRVYGLRIENKGNADVKFFGVSEEPFIYNEPLPGAISDFVWLDEDDDGIQDAMEPGLNGVTVLLLDDLGNPVLDPLGVPLTRVTENGPNGNAGWYQFIGLPQAGYIVEFEPPPEYTFAQQNSDSQGLDGTVNSDVSPITGRSPVINLGPQELVVEVDAGLLAPDYGSLPGPYPTNRADNGARHRVASGGSHLGALPPDRENEATGGGDNAAGSDEDGVLLLTSWTPADPAPQEIFFRLSVGEPGYVSLYLDGNSASPTSLTRATLDAVIGGPAAVTVPAGAANFGDVFFSAAGDYTLRVILPPGSGTSMATRWRITDTSGNGGDSAVGVALSGEVEDHEFEPDDGVPVELAWIHAGQVSAGTRVQWTTASEVGNVGFRLIASDGSTPLHAALVESTVIDSTDPTSYEVTVNSFASSFYIDDIDVYGQVNRRGPYAVGREYGSNPVLDAIAWSEIQTEVSQRVAPVAWQRTSGQAIRLETEQAGIYRFQHADLVAAGVSLAGTEVSNLALTWRDAAIAFHTSAADVFTENDWVEFYAHPADSLYTKANVFLLHRDQPRNHRRVTLDYAAASGVAETHYMEPVLIGTPKKYIFSAPLDDPWYDTRMLVTTEAKRWDFVFSVDDLAESAGTASLELTGWGITQYDGVNDDHHLQVELNLQQVGDVWFRGRDLIELQFDIDPALLIDGDNILSLVLPADTGYDAEVVAFQKATMTYPRAYVAREGALSFESAASRIELRGELPQQPVVYRVSDNSVSRVGSVGLFEDSFEASAAGDGALVIAGGRGPAEYHVRDASELLLPRISAERAPVDLLDAPADYLIISHPLFVDALSPLISFQTSQGRSVRVVDVRDVYSSYSGGHPEAQAIQSFLSEAATRVGYQYALLVGGDTYDYKGYLGNGSLSFVPTLYAYGSDLVRHLPSDALLVDIDGDEMPDRAIGRLPVRSIAELATVIDKTITYHNRDYRKQVALAADESASSASYSSQSESFIDALGDGWTAQRSYLDSSPVAEARASLIGAFDAGQSLVTYSGHSSSSRWTFKGLFSASDVNQLAPNNRPTVVAQWGCWNTYHVSPSYNTLGHRFMLAEDRGAAAVLGSATFTETVSSQALGQVLVPMLGDSSMGIGDALLQAKRDLNPLLARDVILGWTVLGDPSLRVAD